MSTYRHIKSVLESLTPLEILEVCNLHEDPEGLVSALEDHMEENLDLIETELIINGFMEVGE